MQKCRYRISSENIVSSCLQVVKKCSHWDGWLRRWIVLPPGGADLKCSPEGNNKVRRSVWMQRCRPSRAQDLGGSGRIWEGVAGLGLHSQLSLPAPAASNDPLTHFLPAAPAACQGEPLLEDHGGK